MLLVRSMENRERVILPRPVLCGVDFLPRKWAGKLCISVLWVGRVFVALRFLRLEGYFPYFGKIASRFKLPSPGRVWGFVVPESGCGLKIGRDAPF